MQRDEGSGGDAKLAGVDLREIRFDSAAEGGGKTGIITQL